MHSPPASDRFRMGPGWARRSRTTEVRIEAYRPRDGGKYD